MFFFICYNLNQPQLIMAHVLDQSGALTWVDKRLLKGHLLLS